MAIDFRGASQAAQTQPTAGTEGRTQLTQPDFGSAISTFVEAGGQFLKQKDAAEAETAEAQSALNRIDSSIEQGGEAAQFIQNDEESRTLAMVEAIQQDTGLQLTGSDKEVLKMAAAAGNRYNKLASRGPDAARAANIRKARELRKLISQRPEFAGEFRSLIWGNNSFLDDIGADANAEEVEQRKRFVEAATRVQNQLIDAGYHEAAGMEPETVMNYAEETGFTNRMRRTEAAVREARGAKARQEQGEAVDHNDLRRTIRKAMPGMVTGTMNKLQSIANNRDNQYESSTEQLNAIDQAVTEARAKLQEEFPTMTRDQFNSYFGNVLQDIPELYRNRISGGREASEAESQLRLLQAGNRLELEEEFGISTMETAAEIFSQLEPLGILENREKLANADFTSQLVKLYTHVSQNPGEIPPPPRVDPGASPQDLARQQDEFNSWTEDFLGKWDELTPKMRSSLVGNVASGLERASGRARVPVMDKMLSYVAKPEFQQVVESNEWKEMDVKWQRRLSQYLVDLDQSVSTVLTEAQGQVDPQLDEDGVLRLAPSGDLSQNQVNALSRVEGRIQNAIRANAHLSGVSYEQSTREFVEAYLR